MSLPPSPPPLQALPPPPAEAPEATAMLLGVFADLYRQEVASEEDVHRTLPFFGTALGIVIAILAYAAGRLPRWPDLVTPQAQEVFIASGVLLGLSIVEACCVLLWLTRAIARRVAPDIGPEPA
jgi:hypothetical protein